MARIYLLVLVALCALPVFAQGANPMSSDLIQQAEAAYQAKHFSESARLYSKAIPLAEEVERAEITYSLSRAQAMDGNSVAAYETLNRAIDEDFIDGKRAESDTALVSLHADSRWQSLLERMSAIVAQDDAR